MTPEQIAIFLILGATLVLFIWDKWRYDLVAMVSLGAAVAAGLVPADKAFAGFSHPVVVTVACILVMSAALNRSGFIDFILKKMTGVLDRPYLQVTLMAFMVMALSAFMNNIGALAVFVPVALMLARKAGRSPSELLMPMSFASLLGGLLTLIGTPPNLLISSIREKYVGAPYEMFDFAPVGLGLCAAGLAYLAVGWRLIPAGRRGQPLPEEKFAIQDYISEVKVTEKSLIANKTLNEIEKTFDDAFDIVGLVRDGTHHYTPNARKRVKEEDILIVRGDPATLKKLVDEGKVVLSGNDPEKQAAPVPMEETAVIEAVVMPGSDLTDMSVRQLDLRERFGLNLLAVRQNGRSRPAQLKNVVFKEGDVLVLQGDQGVIMETLQELNCLPLAERNLQLGRPRQTFLPPMIMLVAVLLTVFEILPVHIAFAGGVVAVALAKILRLDEIYEAINWPIVVLLGALLPVTDALQTTGAHEILADLFVPVARIMPDFGVLAVVLVASMAVTPFLNNAAAALLMAPVAASLAAKMGLNVDPFLMAVAVGTSCDFLTPIGHQSNTLVLGPGGYKFTDYFRVGLPLTILVIVLGVPLLMFFWPLR